jgi:hypothetical protein
MMQEDLHFQNPAKGLVYFLVVFESYGNVLPCGGYLLQVSLQHENQDRLGQYIPQTIWQSDSLQRKLLRRSDASKVNIALSLITVIL